MADLTIPKHYTAKQAQALTEAVKALQLSPGYKILLQVMEDLLAQRKEELVYNTTATAPTLQGRAQQLIDTIAILNRKI